MTAELGQMALMLALMLATVQTILALGGTWLNKPSWLNSAPTIACSQCVFLTSAFILLATSFVQNDFSVAYVAQNSNTKLPMPYQIAAVWGGHEGSLLLWVLILSLWTAGVAILGRNAPQHIRTLVIGILGLISSGFLILLILTSNPFTRLIPAPIEGQDLNPLLQDPGLVIHPPMLYMGYVGFSVAYAFAITALLSGRIDSTWTRWARPWTLAAWLFLTIGIVLGSWWAYYELGWGGWWFWDPVENASFMPWLTGTALLHSLAVTETRGLFKAWTVLLAILTFSLCLLGTFLVRSGVLTSVHAFATDPARGLFILALLAVTVGGALTLYAWRAPKLTSTGRFVLVSRETGILINNIFLIVITLSVLIGTLYPLILEALGVGKISVGPPYFNLIFVSLIVMPVTLSVIVAQSRWKQDSFNRLFKILRQPLALAIVGGALLPLIFNEPYQWTAALGFTLACWVLFSTMQTGITRLKAEKNIQGGGFWGMLIAHAGIAVFITGVTAVSVYEQSEMLRLVSGERQKMGNYHIELVKITEQQGDNYQAKVGLVNVWRTQRLIAVLRPEKRWYFTRPNNAMTEAGIDATIMGDWYLSLGQALGDSTWSAQIHYKPWVRFIWGGALLMALGGLVAAGDRRYRRKKLA